MLSHLVLRLDGLNVCRLLLDVRQDVESVSVARVGQRDHRRDRRQVARRAAALDLSSWKKNRDLLNVGLANFFSDSRSRKSYETR